MDVRRSYREAAVRGASPLQLVVQLYDQIVEDLRQAALAIDEKNDEKAIRRRSERIKHAILVLAHLQSSLDFANGGRVARNLELFYNVVRQNLVGLQFRPSQRAARQLITDVMAVRSSWVEAERLEGSKSAGVNQSAPSFESAPETERGRADWEG